jgi:putative FmdB family regulatory protein
MGICVPLFRTARPSDTRAYPAGSSLLTPLLRGGGIRLIQAPSCVSSWQWDESQRGKAELPLPHDSTILKLMPIYEYECAVCGRTAAHVVLGSEQLQHPPCPACGSSETRRVMSSFAVVESEAARLASFDTRKPRDESFYRDSRNVGLWAKKRAREMGVDLGSKFDDTVEQARTGKLIKDMT